MNCAFCDREMIGEFPIMSLVKKLPVNIRKPTCYSCLMTTVNVNQNVMQAMTEDTENTLSHVSFNGGSPEPIKDTHMFCMVLEGDDASENTMKELRQAVKMKIPMYLIYKLGIILPKEIEEVNWTNTHVFKDAFGLEYAVKLVKIEGEHYIRTHKLF